MYLQLQHVSAGHLPTFWLFLCARKKKKQKKAGINTGLYENI
jgi:hypothetical protein